MEPTAGSSCPVQECVRYQSVFEPSGARGPVAPATPASGPPITTTAATAPRRGPDPGNDGPRPAVPAPGPGRAREPAGPGQTAGPPGPPDSPAAPKGTPCRAAAGAAEAAAFWARSAFLTSSNPAAPSPAPETVTS